MLCVDKFSQDTALKRTIELHLRIVGQPRLPLLPGFPSAVGPWIQEAAICLEDTICMMGFILPSGEVRILVAQMLSNKKLIPPCLGHIPAPYETYSDPHSFEFGHARPEVGLYPSAGWPSPPRWSNPPRCDPARMRCRMFGAMNFNRLGQIP